jgi:CHAT domain-containing protein
MTAFLLRGAGLVLSTQWSVADPCAAELVLTFVDEIRRPGVTPAAALHAAQQHVRGLRTEDIRRRHDEVEKLFPRDSPEAGKLHAQRAWICWRAGMLDEAWDSAKLAEAPLRRIGLAAEVESLLRNLTAAKASPGFRELPRRPTTFESPEYWAAFQLIGRVT